MGTSGVFAGLTQFCVLQRSSSKKVHFSGAKSAIISGFVEKRPQNVSSLSGETFMTQIGRQRLCVFKDYKEIANVL